MADLKSLLETLKLSFYESIAILVPGVVLVLLLWLSFPKVQIPEIPGVPKWAPTLVAAFLVGHFLKALVAAVNQQYVDVWLPWYQDLKAHRTPWNLKSSKKLTWYLAIPVVRVLTETLLFLFMSLYVPWRKAKPNNNKFYGQPTYQAVRAKVAVLTGRSESNLEPEDCWSYCYGHLSATERQDRDRFDALGDFMQSIVALVLVSMVVQIYVHPIGWKTLYVAAGHLWIARIFYGRFLRFHNLATVNLFRAFFHKCCVPTPSGSAP